MTQTEQYRPENSYQLPQDLGQASHESDIDYGFVIPEKVNVQDYVISPEYANHPEYPIKFYTHKSHPESRMVMILDELPILLPPEGFFPPHVEANITRWEDAERQFMVSAEVMDLIIKVARRYTQHENAVITGPSAVSKSYVAGWIMSSLVGLPYYDATFGPGSETDEMLGAPAILPKRLTAGSVEAILNHPLLLDASDRADVKTLVERITQGQADNNNYAFTPRGETDIRRLFKILDWEDPYTVGELGWQDTDLITWYQIGAWLCIDEKNRAPSQSPLTDLIDPTKRSFNVPGRTGRVMGSRGSFVVATQNVTAYADTEETPTHIESREKAITVGPNGLKFFVDLYNFFIRGANPEFVYEGKKFQWKQDIQTPFRHTLEDSLSQPVLDKLIVELAKLHMTMITMTAEGKLGKKRRKEGGNYVFDQRDVRSILSSINKQLDGYSGDPTDIQNIIRTSLYEGYVDGIALSDMPVVRDLIDNMPIWKQLQPKGRAYDWDPSGIGVTKARKDGGWTLKSTSLESPEPEAVSSTPLQAVVSIEVRADGSVRLNQSNSQDLIELIIGLADYGDVEVLSEAELGPEYKDKIMIKSHSFYGDQLVNMLNPNVQTEKTPPLGILGKLRRGIEGKS